MTGSGRSKSIEPRRWRLRLSVRRQCVHPIELAYEIDELLADAAVHVGGSIRAGVDDGLNLRVGHAACAANDAFTDLVADDLATRINLHEAALHEAIFVRTQAAHPARELRREHRNSAVREVDAGAAEARFEIKVGARAEHKH